METFVGILAIGNEVVEGQITNRNAAWLSEELSRMGATPLYHLSCRDIKDEINQSLDFLSRNCHLIIVSGGLGPTTDDCTRQTLSQWSQAPLEHNSKQWTEIHQKLSQRGVTIRDGHKNQALIPKGAKVLDNSKGVAPGFVLKTTSCFLASLPGPPYELQAMFNDHLKEFISQTIKPKSQQNLETWICLGAPESEVAHITESIIGNELSIGYRLHKPYVEVKLWVPEEPSIEISNRIKKLTEKLSPWCVGRSIKSIRKKFHDYLAQYNHVFVIDHLSEGLFLEKLKENHKSDHLRYQCFEHQSFRYFSKQEVTDILKHMNIQQFSNALFISLFPATEHSVHIAFNEQAKEIKLPSRVPVTSKLGKLYSIEQCFLWDQNG